MLRVFQKDCKITVVEYGGSSQNLMSLKDLRFYISKTLGYFFK